MGYFDLPPGERVLREFSIRRSSSGRWIASETHGLAEGVFFTLKDAFRFALREADDDSERVHVEQEVTVVQH